MDHRVGVKLEEETCGGACAEAEDGDGAGREERWERGEDVEVGVGERLEEEGDAVDVSGGVEEEEAGAAEGVVGFSGNFEDADVVVSGLELGEDFDVFYGDAIFLGFVGLGRGGFWWWWL